MPIAPANTAPEYSISGNEFDAMVDESDLDVDDDNYDDDD
jgi:hypothetical protein